MSAEMNPVCSTRPMPSVIVMMRPSGAKLTYVLTKSAMNVRIALKLMRLRTATVTSFGASPALLDAARYLTETPFWDR